MHNLNAVWVPETDVCLYNGIFQDVPLVSDNYMYCLCALYAMPTVTEDSKENGEIIVKFFLCIYRYEISGSFKLAIVYRCKTLIF